LTACVSIILPTFDRLAYLVPAVESVFAQTFTDWELIVADDGSGQEVHSFLQSLEARPNVKVVRLAHTGRPAMVRNAALRSAGGEFIAFIDSDDLWLPQKLRAQIDSLRAHPARQWSYTRFAIVDRSGRRSGGRQDCGAAPSGWLLEDILRGSTVIALPSVVVARRLLDELGPFDEELVMCEDDELWLRLAAHSEIDGVDQTLTLIRRHAQHSGSDIIAWRDRRRVFEGALRAGGFGGHVDARLRELRAEMAAGLAKSYAVAGNRFSVLSTVCSSLRYSWRYAQWWHGSMVAVAHAFTPLAIRLFVRRHLPLS
jgi:glycosyltransferase involved in cell wall biosynthesis